MSSTTVTIGGKSISVPEMNFRTLKKIYPIIKRMEAHKEGDEEEAVMDDIVDFLVVVLERSSTPMNKDALEEALLVSELPGLEPAVMAILENNGLAPRKGERVPAEEEASPSAGTSTQSSAKSSPDSEAQTGS